jgi:prepilin-type processing-associated H-X9-DG protein
LRKAYANCPVRAFTLTELIVVIGIIMILAALLIPGVKSMVGNSRSAKCRSQLQQIGTVFKLFEADYGFYPPSQFGNDFPPGSGQISTQSWYQGATLLDSYVGTDPNGISALTICPERVAAAPNGLKQSRMAVRGFPYFCNYNIMVGNNPITPLVRTIALNNRAASSLVLLLDASGKTTSSFGGNDEKDFAVSGGSPHSSTTSILWADGHVTQQRASSLKTRDFRFAKQYGGP